MPGTFDPLAVVFLPHATAGDGLSVYGLNYLDGLRRWTEGMTRRHPPADAGATPRTSPSALDALLLSQTREFVFFARHSVATSQN